MRGPESRLAVVMGTTQLVIFRDAELQQLVNIVPLSLIKLTPDARDSTCFQLLTSFWKVCADAPPTRVACYEGARAGFCRHVASPY